MKFETGTVHLFEVPLGTPFRTRNTEGYHLCVRCELEGLTKDWCGVKEASLKRGVLLQIEPAFGLPKIQLVHLPK